MTAAAMFGVVLFLMDDWIHLRMRGFAGVILPGGRPGALRLSGAYLVILASHLLAASLSAGRFPRGFAN